MSTWFVEFYAVGVAAVVLSALSSYWLCARRDWTVSRGALVALMLSALYIPIAQVLKYDSLHMYVDFTAWEELLKNVVQTGEPLSSIQGFLSNDGPSYNWFRAHFTPFLYVLAVPFALLPRPETIIILNVLLMFSSAIALYKLTMHLERNTALALVLSTVLLT